MCAKPDFVAAAVASKLWDLIWQRAHVTSHTDWHNDSSVPQPPSGGRPRQLQSFFFFQKMQACQLFSYGYRSVAGHFVTATNVSKHFFANLYSYIVV
jgi:hypothetical protein